MLYICASISIDRASREVADIKAEKVHGSLQQNKDARVPLHEAP